MKRIFLTLLLLMIAVLSVLAQDSYTVQGDSHCETEVRLLSAGSSLDVTIDGVGPITVAPGGSFEIRQAASNQPFEVAVWSESPDYTLHTSLACPPPSADNYAAIEAEMFRRMNWGPEEIAWFREVYTPMYGNPRAYILGIAEAYEQLDQASALDTPFATATPVPESTLAPVEETLVPVEDIEEPTPESTQAG